MLFDRGPDTSWSDTRLEYKLRLGQTSLAQWWSTCSLHRESTRSAVVKVEVGENRVVQGLFANQFNIFK